MRSFILALAIGTSLSASIKDTEGNGKGKGTQVQCDGLKEVNVRQRPDGFEIAASPKEKRCRDAMNFKLRTKARDGAEVSVRIHKKDDGGHARFSFKQKMFRIIEFNDTNNNNIVDDGEVVQQIRIGDKNQGAWGNTTVSMDENGVYTLQTSAAYFKVIARYSGEPVEFINNGTAYKLNPSAVKIDYIIESFPYQSSTSKLAVDGRFKSKAKMHKRREQKEPATTKTPETEVAEVELRDDGASEGAKFTWIKTVDADGVTVDVVATLATETSGDDEVDKPTVGEKNYKIVWVFDKAGQVDKFVWDPTLSGDSSSVLGEEGDNSSAPARATPLLTLLAGYFLCTL